MTRTGGYPYMNLAEDYGLPYGDVIRFVQYVDRGGDDGKTLLPRDPWGPRAMQAIMDRLHSRGPYAYFEFVEHVFKIRFAQAKLKHPHLIEGATMIAALTIQPPAPPPSEPFRKG